MLIKSADDRTRDIDTLTALLSHPAASPQMREKIGQQIRTIRAGARGEAEAAYEIDFDHGASANWAVLHDLRLEYQGRVAQIDHLLINRCLDVWVCESKHFQQGVAINEHGEFTTFHGSRGVGIPSPLEQNRKHLEVLRAVLGSSLVQLPTRLGLAIRPTLHSVVLVSKGARITRPKKAVPGIDSVVKSDQLRELIDRRAEGNSTFGALVSVARLVAPETLEAFGRQLAALHRPGSFDWAAKFGIAQAAQRAWSAATAAADRPEPVVPPAAAPARPAGGSVDASSVPAQAPAGPRQDIPSVGSAPPADALRRAAVRMPAPGPALAPVRTPPPASMPMPIPAPALAPAPIRPAGSAARPPAAQRTGAPSDARSGSDPAQIDARAPGLPPNPPPSDRSAGGAEPADGTARLPTSKLGARLGARNVAEMTDRLVQAGYLMPNGTGLALTDKGMACGAVFVEKSRHGPYFLWPADLKP